MKRLPLLIIALLLAGVTIGVVGVENDVPSPITATSLEQDFSTHNVLPALLSHPSTDPEYWKKIDIVSSDPGFWKVPTIAPKKLLELTQDG